MMNNILSIEIIKQSIKTVWIWWLISCVVISLNLFAFPTMEIGEREILGLFAETAILGNGIIFSTICIIFFANAFVTSQIDRGTLAIILNTPTTRKQIIFSKMLVFVIAVMTISLFAGAMGSLSARAYGLSFDHNKWWKLIILWSIYSFAVGGIVFCTSCIFNKSKFTLSISSILLGAFFIFYMLSTVDDFEFFKYFSLQTLFDVYGILNDKAVIWQGIVLLVIGLPLYALGSIVFIKKDLPL